MAKEKTKKGKINYKALIIVFAVLCVLVAGVVLAVTYWPAKASDVANTFTAYYQSISDADDSNSVYKQNVAFVEFKDNHLTEFQVKGKTDYANEMMSYLNVLDSVAFISDFYSLNFEGILDSKISRKEAKNVESLLEDSRANMKKMGDYLLENEEKMTNFTVTCASWEAVRDYAKNVIKDYVNVTSAMKTMCEKNIKGVYGNQKFRNVLKGTSDYLAVIEDLLYNEKGYDNTDLAREMSANFRSFVACYYKNNSNLVSNYYINETIRADAKKVAEMEGKTEGKVNFTYLLVNNFEYKELALSGAQEEYVKAGIDFLHGGV